MRTQYEQAGKHFRNQTCNVVLRYHIDELRSKRTDHDCIKYLVVKVIPLIRLLYPDLHEQWLGKKSAYLSRREELERGVLIEVEVIFTWLKRRIEEEGLAEESTINKHILSIASILNFEPRDRWAIPSQYQVACERLKGLFCIITEIGRGDIVKDYVEEFRYTNEYKEDVSKPLVYRCNDCFKLFKEASVKGDKGQTVFRCLICDALLEMQAHLNVCKKTHIGLFDDKKFVPSYFDLLNLEEEFFNSTAGAWDRLYSVEWAWPTELRDYFRKKGISFNTPEESARSVKLLCLYSVKRDIEVIKAKNQGRRVNLFKAENLHKEIDAVIADIAIEDSNVIEKNNTIFPCEIELKIEDYNHLRLLVTWQPGVIEVFHLNRFKELSGKEAFNNTQNFIEMLMDGPGNHVTNELFETAKDLGRAGISGVLDELFIIKKTRNGATLLSLRIELEAVFALKIKRLKKHLKGLESIEWRSQ